MASGLRTASPAGSLVLTGRGSSVGGSALAVLARTLAVSPGVAFVVERVGAVTGGGVDVAAGQQSVREAGVGIVVRLPEASRSRDRCCLPVRGPLPPQQRCLLTGIGGVVAGSSERVALLCQLAQHGLVDLTCPGLALTIGEIRLPRCKILLAAAHGREPVTSPRVMRLLSSTRSTALTAALRTPVERRPCR